MHPGSRAARPRAMFNASTTGPARWWSPIAQPTRHHHGHLPDHLIPGGHRPDQGHHRVALPRVLRVTMLGSVVRELMLGATWAALGWLAATGRMDLAIAATAVIAVRTSTGALTSLVMAAARLFRTSLYLDDWQALLRRAKALRAVRGTPQVPVGAPAEIRAVDKRTEPLERRLILADNSSTRSFAVLQIRPTRSHSRQAGRASMTPDPGAVPAGRLWPSVPVQPRSPGLPAADRMGRLLPQGLAVPAGPGGAGRCRAVAGAGRKRACLCGPGLVG